MDLFNEHKKSPSEDEYVGMHRKKPILTGTSRALLVEVQLNVDEPLPVRFHPKMFQPSGPYEKDLVDCVWYLPDVGSDWGLYSVEPTTYAMTRHPKYPVGTKAINTYISIGSDDGYLGQWGTVGVIEYGFKRKCPSNLQKISDENTELLQRVAGLEHNLDLVLRALKDIYYAPNMPGYVTALNSFKSTTTSKKRAHPDTLDDDELALRNVIVGQDD
jgi:hypothetical protein